MVLVDYIEDLEMQIELDTMHFETETNFLWSRIERLETSWWQDLLTDPRIWFILGAAAGISVAEAR